MVEGVVATVVLTTTVEASVSVTDTVVVHCCGGRKEVQNDSAGA